MTTDKMTALDTSTEKQLNTEVVDDFYFHAVDYIYRRRKFFITLGIIIIAAILIAYGVIRYNADQQEKRAEHYYTISKDFLANRHNPEVLFSKVLPVYSTFITENKGTIEAAFALFQRSNIYLKTGKLSEAEADFQKLIANPDLPSDLSLMASIFLANTLRDQNKGKEAASILEDALRKRPSDILQIELAEAYFSLNDKVKVQQTLNELLGTYPQSLYKERAQKLSDAIK